MKKITLATALLAAAGFSGLAGAHDYSGALGNAATATDKWYFQCLNPNTVKITFQVRRSAGTGCVKATYNATGANTTSCSTTFAPAVAINIATGAGAKQFTINKNPANTGARSYTVRAHCIDKTGVHNPADQTSTQTYTQNQ